MEAEAGREFSFSCLCVFSDGDAARRQHGDNVVVSNIVTRGIGMPSLLSKILSCKKTPFSLSPSEIRNPRRQIFLSPAFACSPMGMLRGENI